MATSPKAEARLITRLISPHRVYLVAILRASVPLWFRTPASDFCSIHFDLAFPAFRFRAFRFDPSHPTKSDQIRPYRFKIPHHGNTVLLSCCCSPWSCSPWSVVLCKVVRSEEHTSELQSLRHL